MWTLDEYAARRHRPLKQPAEYGPNRDDVPVSRPTQRRRNTAGMRIPTDVINEILGFEIEDHQIAFSLDGSLNRDQIRVATRAGYRRWLRTGKCPEVGRPPSGNTRICATLPAPLVASVKAAAGGNINAWIGEALLAKLGVEQKERG